MEMETGIAVTGWRWGQVLR